MLNALLGALQCEHLYWADFWTIDLETYVIPWGTCSSLLSVAVIKHPDQAQLGKDWVYLLQFTLLVTAIIEGRHGRDSNWELGAETMDEGCLVVCFLAMPSFLTLTMDDTIHNGLGIPTQIYTKNNIPKCCLQTNLIDTVLDLRFPLSR